MCTQISPEEFSSADLIADSISFSCSAEKKFFADGIFIVYRHCERSEAISFMRFLTLFGMTLRVILYQILLLALSLLPHPIQSKRAFVYQTFRPKYFSEKFGCTC